MRPATQDPTTHAIVPAAGQASRFGGGKLVADLRGEPLLDHTLRCLLDGGVSRVVVVTAPDADLALVALLADPRVQVVINGDPSRGMFSSIQTGLWRAGAAPVTLVLPGDMPFVRADTVRAVIDAATHTSAIVTPTHHGRRGHPIALPPEAVAAVLSAGTNQNLKDALAETAVERMDVPVDDEGILRDVDVREDLGDGEWGELKN
jgi:molybdenum cofactor cytidylyltransferase